MTEKESEGERKRENTVEVSCPCYHETILPQSQGQLSLLASVSAPVPFVLFFMCLISFIFLCLHI